MNLQNLSSSLHTHSLIVSHWLTVASSFALHLNNEPHHQNFFSSLSLSLSLSHSSITCTVHFLTSLKLTHAHSNRVPCWSFFLLPCYYFPSGGEDQLLRQENPTANTERKEKEGKKEREKVGAKVGAIFYNW